MKGRGNTSPYRPQDDEDIITDIEEEFKPPQNRLTQLLIGALVIITAVSVLIAKVTSDQRTQANDTATRAVAAQSTAVAQVTAMARDARGIGSDSPSAPSGQSSDAGQLRSHDLAYQALSQLPVDPERSLLIAVEALKAANTYEAEDALRRALAAMHFRQPLMAKDGPIQSAVFSPDGRQIVTVVDSRPPLVWSLRRGTQTLALDGHTGTVISAQFSPDGKLILTTSTDKTARLWDAQTGTTVAILIGHEAALSTGAFSSDSWEIATGDVDGTVRLWDRSNITNSTVLNGNIGPVKSLEWSSENQRLLASGPQGLSVWDVPSGRQLFKVDNVPSRNTFLDAHFSPDGKHVVMTGSAPARLLDALTGQTTYTFFGIVADNAQYSPNGQQLLIGDWLWDVKTGQPIYRFSSQFPFKAAFSQDGKYLATLSDPQTVSLWNVQADPTMPEPVTTLKGNSSYTTVGFSPDGRSLISLDAQGTASLWRLFDLVGNSNRGQNQRLPADVNRLIAMAQRVATRELTCAERQTYLQENVDCPTSAQ